MIRNSVHRILAAAALAMAPALAAHAAQPVLIATASIPATYQDLNNQTGALLENGVPGNRLGGIGSSITWAGGDTFLMLPDRGPNAVEYAASIDNTVSYIDRFHTMNLRLQPVTASDAGVQDSNTTPAAVAGLTAPFDVSGLPFILTPTLRATTLLWSPTALVYGRAGAYTSDSGAAIAGGAPALNAASHRYYFTGRSDGFDPGKLSTNPANARLDPEGLKISNDGRSVFISDEYGPYVYQFDRATGARIRSFKLPDSFAVFPNTTTDSETGSVGTDATSKANATRLLGRIANKGAEGLAITPDGRTLAVAMQSALIQDGGTGNSGHFTRIVTIDIASGRVTGQYAYPLDSTTKVKKGVTTIKYNTVSEILAVNNHQFLVDERDGKGFEGGGAAVSKDLYLVDITAAGVKDVSANASFLSNDPSAVALRKTLFLDVVAATSGLIDPTTELPAKLEGITFGPDVSIDGAVKHTLYVSSDNDFLASFVLDDDLQSHVYDNPSKILVFAFDDNDLPGYVPQKLWSEQVPDYGSPEQFPSFLFGLPDYRGPWKFGRW